MAISSSEVRIKKKREVAGENRKHMYSIPRERAKRAQKGSVGLAPFGAGSGIPFQDQISSQETMLDLA